MRVTTDGSITQYALSGGNTPYAITSGPNNSLWFFTGSELTSISTDGTITSYDGTEASGGVGGMATAADGSLWFSEEYGIGQVIMQTATLTALPANPTPSGGAYPGSSLTVTGSAYAAGETVNLNADSTGANQLGTATADSGGAFSVSVKVPELAISELTISGRQVVPWQTVVGVGATSGRIAVARYTVSPLLWPSSTVVLPGSSITVSGFGFGQYESLTMYWNTEANEIWQGHCDEHGAFYGPTAVPFTTPENTAPGTYLLSVMRENHYSVTRYITVQ